MLIALGFMALVAADQPPRRRREREGQRGADHGRAVGLLLIVIFIGSVRRHPGRRRLRPGRGLRDLRATRAPSSRSPPPPRSPSSRWSASRTRSTWPRSARTRPATSREMMLTGLGITGLIYMLVAITAVALVPVGDLATPTKGLGADSRSCGRARPTCPFDKIFPFIADVRGGQHGADQHADGEPAALRHGQAGRAAARARQGAPGAPYAVDRDHLHHAARLRPDHLRGHARARPRRANVGRCLGGTTALLLLVVFTDRQHLAAWCCAATPGDPARSRRRRSLPVVGAVCCAFLARPVGPDPEAPEPVHRSPRVLLAIGVVLWAFTWLTNRGVRAQRTGFRDIEHMEDEPH